MSLEWAGERVHMGVPSVKTMVTRSIMLLAFPELSTMLALNTEWPGSIDMRKCVLQPITCIKTRLVGIQLLSRVHLLDRALIPHTAPEAL